MIPDAAAGSAQDALSDDGETPSRSPGIPELHLDGFDGPLDLLLDLAERRRIDLGRLSVPDLVEQFVAAMQKRVGQVPLERQAEWLVLAARLVLLRSRLMFPANPEAAAVAQKDAVAEEQRLARLLEIRATAAWLEARPRLGRDVFERPRPSQARRTESTMALMEACLMVLRGARDRPEAAFVYRPVLTQLWRPEQALARIRSMLASEPQGGELRHFLPEPGQGEATMLWARGALASTFTACLEMARQGEVAVEQPALFDPIRIRGMPREQPPIAQQA